MDIRPTWKVEGKKAKDQLTDLDKSGKYTSKVLGLKSHTFDVGNTKHTAKFQKSMDAIAIHIQREYKRGIQHCKGNQRPGPSKCEPTTLPNWNKQ